ncbi:CurL C-terminal domain-containing protein, partial [Mycobacterium szulgai]|uniref:CurL C-terminal domain-containing protein n=1 Tax=Mycobacterium szulgai TaxID=1787 RepID=UPI0021F26C41
SDTDTTTTPPGESGESAQPTVLVWPLSARSSAALRAQGARLRQHLLEQPEVSLRDLAYSLATTRSHHPHRAAISTSSTSGADQARQNLLEACTRWVMTSPIPGWPSTTCGPSRALRRCSCC